MWILVVLKRLNVRTFFFLYRVGSVSVLCEIVMVALFGGKKLMKIRIGAPCQEDYECVF